MTLTLLGAGSEATEDTTSEVRVGTISLPGQRDPGDSKPHLETAASLTKNTRVVGTTEQTTQPDSPSSSASVAPSPAAAATLKQPSVEPTDLVEEHITIAPGDTMARVFSRRDLSASTLHRIMSQGDPVARLARLRVGEDIVLSRTQDGQFHAIEFEGDESHHVRVVNDAENGTLVLDRIEHAIEARPVSAHGVIRDSLYLAAQEAGLSDGLTLKLAGIFGWDIDFVLDIRAGDRFTVIYEQIYRNGEYLRDGEILAARFINRDRELDAVRFAVGDNEYDYFSPDGRNMRKAFIRTPVDFRRISSQFNPNRLHPVLKTRRPHRGVDYAANTGTPIQATGDGRIKLAGTHGGYGRTVVIEHAGRYETLYAHMSRIASGIRVGTRVRQGQTIGYVGMTGLASGPHLHYEFRVDGVHKNPLTVDLPAAPPLAEAQLAAFDTATRDVLGQLDILHLGQEMQWRLAEQTRQRSSSMGTSPP
jgi:murein DD-endopeptidase MepM/ murein hydrolase activator NlpD